MGLEALSVLGRWGCVVASVRFDGEEEMRTAVWEKAFVRCVSKSQSSSQRHDDAPMRRG